MENDIQEELRAILYPKKPKHWDDWTVERQLGYTFALDDTLDQAIASLTSLIDRELEGFVAEQKKYLTPPAATNKIAYRAELGMYRNTINNMNSILRQRIKTLAQEGESTNE
jgi:hypothetical protein